MNIVLFLKDIVMFGSCRSLDGSPLRKVGAE